MCPINDSEQIAFRPGCQVVIGGDIKGYLLGTQIHADGSISYLVSWWCGRERRTDTFSKGEVMPTSKTEMMFMVATTKD